MVYLKTGLVLIAAMFSAGCDVLPGFREAEIERCYGVFTGVDNKFPLQVNDETGFAFATGIWTLDGDDKIADPINITMIFCNKAEVNCEEHRSWITNATERPTLMMKTETYRITAWQNGKIVAVSPGDCRSIELMISLPDNSVIGKVTSSNNCRDQDQFLKSARYQRLISGKQLDDARK